MSAREDDKPMDPISVVFEADAQRSAAYKEEELIGECEFCLTHESSPSFALRKGSIYPRSVYWGH